MPWLQGAENMKELLKTTEEGRKKIKHRLLFPLISSPSPSLLRFHSVSRWHKDVAKEIDFDLKSQIKSCKVQCHCSCVVMQSIWGHSSLHPVGGSNLNPPPEGLNGLLLLLHEQPVIQTQSLIADTHKIMTATELRYTHTHTHIYTPETILITWYKLRKCILLFDISPRSKVKTKS